MFDCFRLMVILLIWCLGFCLFFFGGVLFVVFVIVFWLVVLVGFWSGW